MENDHAADKQVAALIFKRPIVHCFDNAEDRVLHPCLTPAALPWNVFEAACVDQGSSELIRRNVERSIQRSVFGSPFIIVNEEPLFGLERLPVVEEWLAAGGW